MRPAPGERPWPSRGPAGPVLLALALAVLGAHLVLLAGIGGMTPVLQPASPDPLPSLQTRLITPPPLPKATPPAVGPAAAGRSPTARLLTPADIGQQQADARPAAPSPEDAREGAGEDVGEGEGEAAVATAAAAPASEALSVEAQAADTPGTAQPRQAKDAPDGAPDTALSAGQPIVTAAASAVDPQSRADAQATGSAVTGSASAAQGPADPVPAQAVPSEGPGAALQVDPAHLPPSLALHYDMTGQDRGLTYHASGELRWQYNPERYTLSLAVRALLVGSREWRSQGLIGPQGLQPLRFSDKRRTERATHFDREGGRVVFSGNAAPVPLAPGAQDQISLYVQLAAAMASASGPMPAGTRLQVQTATTRDALPWLLTLERRETLRLDGQPVDTAYWVCLPRQRFDARIELWTAAQHHQLPVRIRITQASGSFIDLQLRRQEALEALPAGNGVGTKTTSP